MKTALNIALHDAGVKRPRAKGLLSAVLDYMRSNPSDAAHPLRCSEIAGATGFTTDQVARALSNAYKTYSKTGGLRRTTSSEPGRRWDYYLEGGQKDATRFGDLVERVAEAREALQEATRVYEEACDDLREYAAHLPDPVLRVLRDLGES